MQHGCRHGQPLAKSTRKIPGLRVLSASQFKLVQCPVNALAQAGITLDVFEQAGEDAVPQASAIAGDRVGEVHIGLVIRRGGRRQAAGLTLRRGEAVVHHLGQAQADEDVANLFFNLVSELCLPGKGFSLLDLFRTFVAGLFPFGTFLNDGLIRRKMAAAA